MVVFLKSNENSPPVKVWIENIFPFLLLLFNIIKIGINNDYIHLFMIIPPKYLVNKVVEIIKKNISRSL